MKDHCRPKILGAGASKFRKQWTGLYTVIQKNQNNFLIKQGQKERWVNGEQLARWYPRRDILEEKADEGSKSNERLKIWTRATRRAPKSKDRTRSKVRKHRESGDTGLRERICKNTRRWQDGNARSGQSSTENILLNSRPRERVTTRPDRLNRTNAAAFESVQG